MRYFVIFALCAACSSSPGHHVGSGNPDLSIGSGGDDGGAKVVEEPDPTTCAEAAQIRSNVGCEYWPTVTPNTVRKDFDFAVVVANTGGAAADVTITGGALSAPSMTTVAPGQLAKIYLPWVPELKQDNGDECNNPMDEALSVRADGKAYHLVSTTPVVVYQFNALEYAGKGGPPGKDWLACEMAAPACGQPGCFSYTNDASLLLPSTALTGNYRVIGWHASYGWGNVIAITATQDNTSVSVKLSLSSNTLAGAGVLAIPSGGTQTFNMNQGDVVVLATAQISTTADLDLGGSLVKADKPIQVISADQCASNPDQASACDHLEESVFPAETLGKHYLVAGVTGPQGQKVGQTVRLVGNVNGTKLTYSPMVAGAPNSLQAGQVAEIGPTDADFEITGDHEFTVATVQQGGSVVDPGTPLLKQRGDPSLSQLFAVEQYRRAYLFLAPDDYDENFVDVIAPTGAMLVLDGQAVTVMPTPIGASGFAVVRIALAGGMSDAHTLTSDEPMGIQVIGYGAYTSYQYPGGGNLHSIASPPIQ